MINTTIKNEINGFPFEADINPPIPIIKIIHKIVKTNLEKTDMFNYF